MLGRLLSKGKTNLCAGDIYGRHKTKFSQAWWSRDRECCFWRGRGGALAIGALSIGALAIGALAIGRLVIRRLQVDRLKLNSVEIGELRVGRIRAEDVTVSRSLILPAQPVERSAIKIEKAASGGDAV